MDQLQLVNFVFYENGNLKETCLALNWDQDQNAGMTMIDSNRIAKQLRDTQQECRRVKCGLEKTIVVINAT